jgi:hypothetical protein
MTPRRDRQAYDDMTRWAASAATDVGADQRQSWLRTLGRQVNLGDVALAVIAILFWVILLHLVLRELMR